MNICLISREFPPFYGGGIGTYTVRFAEALTAAGHGVVVVTASGDGRELREKMGDITVVRLPFLRGIGHEADWSGPHPAVATAENQAVFRSLHPVSVFAREAARALPRIVEEFSIDAVEAPDTGALAWFVLEARRRGALWAGGGPAVVVTVHSPTEWIARVNKAEPAGRGEATLAEMERDCAAWADGLVCPSRALATWAEGHWGLERGRIEVCRYALGELERTARSVSVGATTRIDGPVRIVYAGRLEPRKGVDTLLEAFAGMCGRGVDAVLDLAGEDMALGQEGGGGKFGEGRVRMLAPHVAERVRPRGRLGPEELVELQGAADVVAVPSPMDNFPFACVEAMARGRVVVGARAGGTAEMIRDGVDGLLFEPGDAPGCGRALERAAVMGPDKRSAMGRSAAARIVELCGNDRVAAQRVALFGEAMSRRRSAGMGYGSGFVVLGRGRASSEHVRALKDAAAKSGAAFALGWTRDPEGRVRALASPRVRTLMQAEQAIGPVVVDERAWEACGAAAASRRVGENGDLAAPSAWGAALVLASAGFEGIVVPDVIVETDDPMEPNVARRVAGLEREAKAGRIAAAELEGIKGSRGWRFLQCVYDMLHVARGRGLKR